MRRLSRSGEGWPVGVMIMVAIVFAAIVAAVALIVYEVEVYLPARQGVEEAPAITHQKHPPL